MLVSFKRPSPSDLLNFQLDHPGREQLASNSHVASARFCARESRIMDVSKRAGSKTRGNVFTTLKSKLYNLMSTEELTQLRRFEFGIRCQLSDRIVIIQIQRHAYTNQMKISQLISEFKSEQLT